MTAVSQEIRLRRATAGDEARVLDWRNEREARRASFGSHEIAEEEHRRWYRARLQDESCFLYIVEYGGTPIGNIRFDLDRASGAEVHISLDRAYRGRGLSAPAMRMACSRVVEEAGLDAIVARIKDWNEPSIRLFRSAGFVEHGSERIGSSTAVVYRRTSRSSDGNPV